MNNQSPIVNNLALSATCRSSAANRQSATERGKVMTLAFAIGRTGGTLASFTGPPAYTAYGIWGLGPAAGIAIVFAVLITLLGTCEISD